MFLVHAHAHVVQRMKLLIQTSDLVVFDYHQLIEFIDFLLSVSRLSLVTLEHSEETVNAFVAGLADVVDNLLAHLCLLLVHFEIRSDLFGILDKIAQVLFLCVVSLLNFAYILCSYIYSRLLKMFFVLCLGNK